MQAVRPLLQPKEVSATKSDDEETKDSKAEAKTADNEDKSGEKKEAASSSSEEESSSEEDSDVSVMLYCLQMSTNAVLFKLMQSSKMFKLSMSKIQAGKQKRLDYVWRWSDF